VADVTTQDETLFENPQFEHYEATSNIQLFFDLFFVANLASFTNVHEINSSQSLSPIPWLDSGHITNLSLLTRRIGLLRRFLLRLVVYLGPGDFVRCPVRYRQRPRTRRPCVPFRSHGWARDHRTRLFDGT
jgi:hypothetical protein